MGLSGIRRAFRSQFQKLSVGIDGRLAFVASASSNGTGMRLPSAASAAVPCRPAPSVSLGGMIGTSLSAALNFGVSSNDRRHLGASHLSARWDARWDVATDLCSMDPEAHSGSIMQHVRCHPLELKVWSGDKSMMFSGRAAPREKEYLFIDGGCLRAVVSKMSRDIFGDKDAYRPLIQALASNGYEKIFYYDAVPGRGHDEPQAAYEHRVKPDYERMERIQALKRVHIALGKIVGENKRQKGVDIQLAVDMLTHAFRGNITRVTLFAGDADFTPLIRALVGEGLQVTLWHPPQASKDLRGAADITRLFGFRENLDCFTKNDLSPAFHWMGSENSAKVPDDAQLARLSSGHRVAARWRGDALSVWFESTKDSWYYTSLAAPDGNLIHAAAVLDQFHRWGISDTIERWVQY